MGALIAGCLAASGGAMIGLWVGTTLTCSRTQDLEFAYRRLHTALDRLIEEHEMHSGHAVLSDEMLESVYEALDESDTIVFPELPSRRRRAA